MSQKHELPLDVCTAWYGMLTDITDENGVLLAGSFSRLWDKLIELHPEFTAYNSYAALLEALEACEKEMRGLDTLIQSGTWRQHFTYAHELAKTAIAKAKAEQS